MRQSIIHLLNLSVVLLCMLFSSCDNRPKVLVFQKVKNRAYHESTPDGDIALMKLGEENGFKVDTTSDAGDFTDGNLEDYRAIIFYNTVGDILTADQQLAMERYIQAGGGFVGIHAATNAEPAWPWFTNLIGAQHANHPLNPNFRSATIVIKDSTHLATQGLPQRWEFIDEWYNFKNMYTAIHVLATVDEDTYEGGEHGDNHPIAWYHAYDGGRSFYTALGHRSEAFEDKRFLKHLLGGIKYAMGNNVALDYSKAYAVKTPDENRFTKSVLSNDLNEPMELAVAPDGRVFFCERKGNLFAYNPSDKSTKLVHQFAVMPDNKGGGSGNGLLGVTLDPAYENNNFIYFYYTPDTLPAHQNVSRFTLGKDNTLDLASEKVLLQIPIELESSAHTGGSLAWDKQGNLFISTGDNTVPFASDGFAPIDETPGRITFDAQRSAGNTNDLRGKILRIHPEADGTYTIPDGNLFPRGTAQTRPEIYAMGCRNPYRIAVDHATSILYWGEIGPDAGADGTQGPRGYDEFNQAKKPGNYGWPYFVGDSKPYRDYDFGTKTAGDEFNPDKPVNHSPLNTGLKALPPAQKAMIWYPYDKAVEFPEVGTGGRSAMAGAFYHYDDDLTSSTGFPEYYDKSLFVFDWMRNWMFVVRFDEEQNFKRLEPFMATTGDFRRPIDMEIGPDGAAYLLEYGSVYGIDNVDARLVRIDYNEGNRAPRAKAFSSDTVGNAPLRVAFSSSSSKDFDEEDVLKFQWVIDGKNFYENEPEYTFEKNGKYKAILTVTDPSGQTGKDSITIRVGNTVPDVTISSALNSTFFFNGTAHPYRVEISDNEDESIAPSRTKVTLRYIPKIDGQIGHQQLSSFNLGKSLMEASDCKACHQLNGKSVGPAFMDVARKYRGDDAALARLAVKVIAGGGGVWGDHAMNAHPQLSEGDAKAIVSFVLSLGETKEESSLPLAGSLTLKEHKPDETSGRYALTASYTDGGGALEPLTGSHVMLLRPARVLVREMDRIRNAWYDWDRKKLTVDHKSYFLIKNVDLKNIRQITCRLASETGAEIEIHTGTFEGPVIGTVQFASTGSNDTYKEVTGTVKDPGGKNDLYFVFRKKEKPNKHVAVVEWVEFRR